MSMFRQKKQIPMWHNKKRKAADSDGVQKYIYESPIVPIRLYVKAFQVM